MTKQNLGASGPSRLGASSNLSSKFSESDDVTVSKSLTDLANLPLPIPTKKPAAGWNDDGFDDWNFEVEKVDNKVKQISQK